MSDWKFINAYRVRIITPNIHPKYITNDSHGFNGMFRIPLAEGGTVRCIASDGMGWQHISVTVEGDIRPPRWSVMCWIKNLFWEDEDWVMQFHPAKAEYVNYHPACLHLWKPTGGVQFPTPQTIMVGPKTKQ